MTNVLRLAIVDPNDATRESLKSMLLGMDMCWLEAESSRYEFFVDIVGQTNPDIGVIGIDARSRQSAAADSRTSARRHRNAASWWSAAVPTAS